MDISAITALASVVPVLTVEGPADAVPLAHALVKGGLPALEITLRTAGALDALRAIGREVPGAVIGAGTVLNPAQLAQAVDAGARFIVSPGCTAELARAALDAGIAFLPGVQTVSEAMALANCDIRLMKFFPAEAAGGIGWLKAVAAPLPDVRFCPTGGVTAENARSYLDLGNVACVGGSWVAPKSAMAARDWPQIERLAATAAGLKRR